MPSAKWRQFYFDPNVLNNSNIIYRKASIKYRRVREWNGILYLAIIYNHDNVIKWKHFPCYWPFVWGIHQSTVNSPHIGPVKRSFDVVFDLRLNKRHRAHYNITEMNDIKSSKKHRIIVGSSNKRLLRVLQRVLIWSSVHSCHLIRLSCMLNAMAPDDLVMQRDFRYGCFGDNVILMST